MELLTSEQEGVAILEVSGEIDLYNAPQIRDTVQKLIERGIVRIVVDLDRVTYIDSSGIGALISALSQLKKSRGSLRIANVTGSVLKVFELTRLTSFFEIFPSVAEALSASSGSSAG